MKRTVLYLFLFLITSVVVGAAGVVAAVAYAWPQLPSLESLTDYRPRIPMRVYAADGTLLGEFGEERRSVVDISQVPDVLKKAILATEDARFYAHRGVDPVGVLRAAVSNITSGGRGQGASTITMQVARNFFLSRERAFGRKFYEALLALKIEQNLNKDKILEIYINQIFLGHRAYGFAAAAKVYFNKSIGDLTLPEAAMLAGIPKGPSIYNPISNPKLARERELTVLWRMLDEGFIDRAAYDEARAVTVTAVRGQAADTSSEQADAAAQSNLPGDYVAEMARLIALEQFGDAAYTLGLHITTTINRADQMAAVRAVRKEVLAFDRRHGYRGPEGYVDISGSANSPESLSSLLATWPDQDDLLSAIVLSASPTELKLFRNGNTFSITGKGLAFVAPALKTNAPQNLRIRAGSIVRVRPTDKGGWEIVQLPKIEAALVALDARTGAVRALVGGFDFDSNKFNNITQAWRQPGSSFKPFIFSAALEKGYSPPSYVDDSPIEFPANVTGSKVWAPHNYDGTFDGLMTVRTALARSRNIPAVRLLNDVTPAVAQQYITRFGFTADKNPAYLTMALGAGNVTPWQMASAYAVFANGGFKIDPYIISEIKDAEGNVLARTTPVVVGETAPRVLNPRNAWLMDSMLREVTISGTAAKARKALQRSDLAGKTGTTNDFIDAWFAGYASEFVAVSWMGYSRPKSMGRGEGGSTAALPIWIEFMRTALKDVPEKPPRPLPGGLAPTINSDTGREDYYYPEYGPPLPPEPEYPDWLQELQRMLPGGERQGFNQPIGAQRSDPFGRPIQQRPGMPPPSSAPQPSSAPENRRNRPGPFDPNRSWPFSGGN